MNTTRLEGTHLGQYVLTELLRVGSLTEVYRGYQESLKRDVMVKVLKQQFQAEADHRRAFALGTQIHAGLNHPHIVPIYDYGELEHVTFAVYRLMQHGVLETELKNGPLPLQQAAGIVSQIAGGLEYVHSRQMAHGDPSTSNIVFDDSGNAYIANFHMAGFQGQGTFAGTASFSAPERWTDNTASPYTDQYALGCITYYLITGKTPFGKAQSIGALMQAHLESVPPAPQELNPDVPLAVNDVLNRAMAKHPGDRYLTITDFAREFEKALQDVPKHLFISYSRRDKEYAALLSEHLSGNGFTVWIDSKIEYGDTWFKEIDEAIKSCAAFLLVMSPDSYESEWVQKEILLAKRYKKPIFPLLLGGQEFGIVIDLQFADVRAGGMPDIDFHRRLRRTVFGEA